MQWNRSLWRFRLQIVAFSLVNLGLIAAWMVNSGRSEVVVLDFVQDPQLHLQESAMQLAIDNKSESGQQSHTTAIVKDPRSQLPWSSCSQVTEWNEQMLRWLPDPKHEFDGNKMPIAKFTESSDFNIVWLPMFDHIEGEAFYIEMDDALLLGPFLKLYNCHFVYFPGGCNKNPEPFPLNTARHTPASDLVVVEHVVIISQFWGSAYYHWLIESLPRLAALYDYIQANSDAKILMYDLSDITWELLTLLDLDPGRRLIPFSPDRLYFIRHAVVPAPAPCGHPLSAAIRHLKELIRSKAAEKFPHEYKSSLKLKLPYTIVVQHRAFYGKRYVLNQDELVKKLIDANPDANVVEFGPGEGFWPMFKKHIFADIIIGPHGAGLSNVLFAPDSVTMVELHPDQGNQEDGGRHHINLCHQRTANRTGVKSVLLLEDNGDADSPFYVNTARLVETVAKIRSGLWNELPMFDGSELVPPVFLSLSLNITANSGHNL